MPRYCTFCGATNGNFRFPKDEEARQRWRRAIPRKDIPTHKDTVICEKHWPANFEKVSVHGKWRPRDDDPPSIFDVPKSVQPTPTPPPRKTKRSSFEARTTTPDEMEKFLKMDSIQDFDTIKESIRDKLKEFGSHLFVLNLENQIIVLNVELVEGTGVPCFLFKILHDLSFHAYHFGVKCSIPSFVRNRVTKIKHWSEIEEMLRFLKVTDPNHKQTIAQEQLRAMGMTVVGEKKYSVDTMVRAFEYFALSRSTYSRLRQDFELPCISSLTTLTSKIKSVDDSTYISNVFSKMMQKKFS